MSRVRLAAGVAVTMAVAIAVSGVKEGDIIPSLTFAPALLAACVYLLWSENTRRAFESRNSPRVSSSS